MQTFQSSTGAKKHAVAAAALVLVPLVLAVAGPWLAPQDPVRPLGQVLAPPGTLGVLGTDHLGRDVLSRVLAGGRSVVLISVAALLAAEAVGVTIGIAAGYSRRFGRAALLGVAELFLAVPPLLLLAAVVAGFGRSPLLLLTATAVVLVPSLVPIVATATSTLTGQPWVEAAVLSGESRRAVLYRELLPNLLPVLAADAGIRLVSAVYLTATAGFLGFGPEPPTADWGLMIAESRTTMSLQPWPVILPATLITAFALGMNLLARQQVESTQASSAAGTPNLPGAVPLPTPPDHTPVPAALAPFPTTPATTETAPDGHHVAPTTTPTDPNHTAAAHHQPTAIHNHHPTTPDAAVVVRDLCVTDAHGRAVLDHVSLRVPAGQAVALVGPSGSGKTTLALSLLGHVRDGLRVTGGTVTVRPRSGSDRKTRPRSGSDLKTRPRSGSELKAGGVDPFALDAAARRALRRARIRYVPQDPAAALTPSLRVDALLGEALGGGRRAGRGAAADHLLELVRLPTDRAFRRRLPHQLSGGQRQRLTLAMALAGDPEVVVLDEPTAALDTVTRTEVTAELARLAATTGCTFLLVTHDLAVAEQLADEMVVLDGGRVIAAGLTRTLQTVQRRPTGEPSSRQIAPFDGAARSAGPDAAATTNGSGLLTVRGVRASYAPSASSSPLRSALRDVDLTVGPGECVVVVGESGSGKTTLARCVTGLHTPDAGRLTLDGQPLGPVRQRGPALRRRIGLVFQDPMTSLNPARRVADLIGRPARLRGDDPAEVVPRLLREVRLPERYADRRPRALSGGERQRVAIARALAARPDVLVCDEITSALDPAVTAVVCDLLDELRRRHGLALLVITHDLAVAQRLAHRVIVLADGAVAEHGPADQVLTSPTHPATRRLTAAATLSPTTPATPSSSS